jgi:ubiquinone/menaquinone biosynthesis C-methylase UbiE
MEEMSRVYPEKETMEKTNTDAVDKKIIQKYWTDNVPGLNMTTHSHSPEEKEFYIEVDAFRYRYDSYIVPLIDSFVRQGEKVLEIGCGMGTDSRYISRKGANIVSLDLSFNNVSFALKGMRLMDLKGKGVNADAERLPFKDDSFDVVYSFGVLHHTPDTQKAINEVYRVLKPGGKCVIMLYHKGYAYYALLLMHGYKKIFGGYTKDRLMSEYDNTPLSRLYSKNELKKIFRRLKGVNIAVTAYGGTQAHPFLKYVHRILKSSSFLMCHFGSFAIITGEK